MPFGKR
ncbi:hypothetical protein D049_5146A, partial [Vibrio parahaemolyticus VPTS-2010]